MIPLKELHVGNWVIPASEGNNIEGQIEQVDNEQAYVNAMNNLFWYNPDELDPIPLTEEQLASFGFVKSDDPVINGHGQAYIRGPFTLKYVDKNNKDHISLTYMGDHSREITDGLYVHQLQNHYNGMTKILLEKE